MDVFKQTFSAEDINLLILKELQLIRQQIVPVILRMETKMQLYDENLKTKRQSELNLPKVVKNESLSDNFVAEKLNFDPKNDISDASIVVDQGDEPCPDISEVCIELENNSDHSFNEATDFNDDNENDPNHHPGLNMLGFTDSHQTKVFTTEAAGDSFCSSSEVTMFPSIRSGPLKSSNLTNEEDTESYKLPSSSRSQQCNICSKICPSERSLIKHLYSHCTDVFECCFCSASFLLKKQLTKHIYSVHKENPDEYMNRSQPFCAKKRKVSDMFKDKLAPKPDEKISLTCKFCSHTYSSRSTLNRHMNSHTLLKIYECDICHKTFNRKDYLTRHINMKKCFSG